MFSGPVVRFVLRCIYICTPIRFVLSSAPKSAHLPVRWNSHQVWNWQKRSWSRELGVWDMYMHKVNSLFLPRPSNTCHTIPPLVIIPSGSRHWDCFLDLMGMPPFGSSGADREVHMSFRSNWLSGVWLGLGSQESLFVRFLLLARFQLDNAEEARHTYQAAWVLRSKWRKSLECGLELVGTEPYNRWSNSRKARKLTFI